jgi:uncharacterized protein YdcH (DUF465 family)
MPIPTAARLPFTATGQPILPPPSQQRPFRIRFADVTVIKQESMPHHQIEEIVPMDLHHPILREFPEHREVIRQLKGVNDHFRNVFDEYHRLDDEIYRIEEEIDFATDQEIEELKMRRTKLKDYIYHVIRHAPGVCLAYEDVSMAS